MAASGLDAWTHFRSVGAGEGRQPSPYFDSAWYLATYPDVAASGLDPFWHYIVFGRHEGRAGIPQAEPIWAMGLQEIRAPIVNNGLVSESYGDALKSFRLSKNEKHIVVFDWSIPTPDLDSGSLRITRLLRILLSLDYRVTLCVDQPAPFTRYVCDLENLGIDVHIGTSRIQAFLQQEGFGVGVVWILRPMTAANYLIAARAYCPSAKLIYDTVDIHWIRMKRQQEFDSSVSDKDVEIMRRLEHAICSMSDRVVTVTEPDRQFLLSIDSSLHVYVVPNIHVPGLKRHSAPQNHDIVFLGSFDHAPNRDGLKYFLDEVWGRVLAKLPNARFFVVGSRLEDWVTLEETDSVKPFGFVEEISPLLRGARVMIVPLRFGAGMKGKIGSALEEGLPVVTTTIGAEGIGLTPERNALIADSADEIAEAIRLLCTDDRLWLRLSHEGQHFLSCTYSFPVVKSRIQIILQESPIDEH